MPKLWHDGLLIAGDSAGFLNASRLKGVHLAIKSGMLAAETVVTALGKGTFDSTSLSLYGTLFDQSWARQELYGARNFHAGFKGGLLSGLAHAALQTATGGNGIFNRREHEQDSKHMLSISDYERRYGQKPSKPMTTFDNALTFDKLTDVYKSGTMHEEHQPSHLVIADYNICNTKCTEEFGNPCQHFCPANVYNMVVDDIRPGKLKLQLTPSNCVHCKTCDIADPYQVIRWVVPQGGEGPNYTNL
jgi:electron-transferring-flavoprotein dehydrogenase